MSLPPRYILCTRCDFEQPYPFDGCLYKYRCPGGEEVLVPVCIGWCMHCNKFVIVQEGLVVSHLISRLATLKKRLITIKKSFLYHLSSSWKREAKDLLFRIDTISKQLLILNGRNSLNACLTCGSVEVFPITKDIETFSHIDCGGDFRYYMDEDGIRFHIAIDDKFVEPVFASSVQVFNTRNAMFN